MSVVSKGKILLAIREGAKFFTEIEKKSGVSSAILGKHLKDLEREGLITVIWDRSSGRMRPIYKLNESRRDEISELINAYLESEKKEFIEKLKFVTHNIKFTEEEKKMVMECLKNLQVLGP